MIVGSWREAVSDLWGVRDNNPVSSSLCHLDQNSQLWGGASSTKRLETLGRFLDQITRRVDITFADAELRRGVQPLRVGTICD